ncbi:citrate transporter [Petralouisia muris]|jgi:di/tricarboxylate transporter|uniref:Citrate transporter n=1 Tax=Petralouisia muris TaxID=3032872 RepID=A0AC61RTL3_9FIRM|nr:SLC13 family permease [Petralouisia muris]TGY95174.1 citrate transporter [Petralouisia muris]
MDSSIVSIIIVLIIIGLFVWNKLPISVVSIGGSIAMALFIPEMELSAVYSGFSATGWPMVVGMCIVSAALFETGIARQIGERIGNSFLAKTERRFIVTVSAVCSLMSAFMSNNGTVAIWMPIIAIVAANSSGRIRSKMVIFPAGTSAIIGGACSLIGSTSQLAANSVLQGYAGYEEGMGMFDMTKIMLPAAIVQVIFWGTLGYKLLDKVLKPESPDFDKGNIYAASEIRNLEQSREADAPALKGKLALFTMILCIILFVLSGFMPFKTYFNIGIIGLLGAAIVLAAGCISVKKAYADLPWDVLVCIGTISGIGTGLDVSGGGALIANFVLNLFGGQNASVVMLTIVIALLTSVLTNIMSNNATAAMLTPICIAIALSLGISPLPWVIVIGACSNLAIATSFGTAVNMQILPAGYKFSDFVKIGGPLLILLIAVATVSSVVFLF